MNGDHANPPTEQQQPAAPAQSGPEQKSVVVQKIQAASNILVAVSSDPSIDQLASAIALTLLLEKSKKNATAVFSGKVPSALEFLKPGETFEKTTDSLRDFIIAIDKSKADKLRYKVEDNVVKIFITPYKTSITEKDLQYNAGDFNVDLIIALGVKHQQDLDEAITSHGRIFHDAIVVSINDVPGGDFGIANWEDTNTSSLSELIARLAGDLGSNLLDSDIATSLLTGIVAETSRFSNDKTHPGTMTISSQLLEAGADQQLVNQQLQSVMNTDVKLQAGAQIKPTVTPEEREADKKHEHEELVVGSDGSLNLPGKPADDSKLPESDFTLPAVAEESNTDVTASDDASVSDKGSSKEDKTADSTDQKLEEDTNDPEDSDAARLAVTDALQQAAAEVEAMPAIDVVPAPALSEFEALDSEPQPGQAEQANSIEPTPDIEPPLDLSQLLPPAAPESTVPPIGAEPAPLASSPADQPFTMPLPPTSSMNQAPIIPPTPAPGQQAGAIPPPLPPPIVPPVP